MTTYFRRNPDGTAVYQQVGNESIQVASPAEVPLRPETMVDDLTAVQLGAWYILDSLEVVSVNRAKLFLDGQVVRNPFRFTRIILDVPDSEDTMSQDAPAVRIYADGEVSLDLQGDLSVQDLQESTLHQFGQGTVLRKLYESSLTLMLDCNFTNKDDRSAARKALVSAFAKEPLDSRTGRRVIISAYYDRIASYDLVGISYDDSFDNAQRKIFPMGVRLTAAIEVVDLVTAPAEFRPEFNVESGFEELVD